jgi:hypothetical protein
MCGLVVRRHVEAVIPAPSVHRHPAAASIKKGMSAMITRIKLPHEDDFLHSDDVDVENCKKLNMPFEQPKACTCSCPVLSLWSMVLSGIFFGRNIIG